jgi:hypothetical protein
MVTKTKPNSTTPPQKMLAGGTTLSWSTTIGPLSFATGSVTYTDRTKGVDWRKMIKEGHDATTQAQGFKRTFNGDRTYLLAKSNLTGEYTGAQDLLNVGLSSTAPHHSQAYQLAIGDAIQSAKAVQHEFNAGSFLAELRETIGFLVAPLKSVRRRSMQYHRRIKDLPIWRETKKSKLSRLSDYWLSYRFGVLPLLSDIDSAMLELATKNFGQPPTLPFRGKGYWATASSVSTSGAYLSIWRFTREEITAIKTNVTIRGNVRLQLPTQVIYPPSLVRVFEDFVPSLYEAIPWSWAFDYFTNIGDILNCLTYCEANITWANSTKLTRLEIREDLRYSEIHPSYTYFSSKGRNSEIHYRLWNRDSVLPASLVPRMVYRLPVESPIKLANLAAVTFQKFR